LKDEEEETMSRYRNDLDEDRYYSARGDRFDRERAGNFEDPYERRSRSRNDFDRRDYGRGRYGERADYEHDEPRYRERAGSLAREDFGRSSYEGRDYLSRGPVYYDRSARSRLRCRDIMTRDLAVATRDTTLREVASMMKEEDTGVIPVIDYASDGNGRTTGDDRRLKTTNYSHGKLVGLITDRDIVVRAVADGKDCNTTRVEELMSTDIHTARPHDRVVDVIKKMGDKQVRRIPVVSENGILRGIISMGDIAVETEADRELADALEDISKESSFWNRLFG
jgi:CBS domain-containing protein